MRRSATTWFVIVGVVAVAILASAFGGRGSRSWRLRGRDIPMRIANWRGAELAHEPQLYGIPLSADYVARSYVEPGGSVVDLLVVCGEDLGALGDPAWNLRTQGWKVDRLPRVKKLPAEWLLCRREQTEMIVCYWFSSAAGEGPSLAAQELELGFRNLVGGGVPHDVAVCRVTIAAPDDVWAQAEAIRFVRSLLANTDRP